ncbi:MAG TPA: hypothetical protein VGE24_08325, partial [Emticicia sp.]
MSKNIHDLSDDEFDDLFRESAEKSSIGFDPEAWNKMSQKLDAATTPPSSPGKGGNPLTKWILPAMIVLLLLITGTYFLVRKPSETVTGTKAKAKENSVKQTDKVGEKDVATDKVDTENQENAKEATNSNDKVQTDKIDNPSIAENNKRTSEALKSTDNIAGKSKKTIADKTKQSQQDKAYITKDTKSATQTEKIPVESGQNTKVKSSNKKANNNKIDKKSSDGLAPEDGTNQLIIKERTEAKSQTPDVVENKADKSSNIVKNNKRNALLKDSKTINNKISPSKTDETIPTTVSDGDLKIVTQSQVLAVDSASTVEKMQWAPIHILAAKQPMFDVNLKLPDVHYQDIRFVRYTGNSNQVFKKGLSIRLALSPDFSFIPSNNIFKVGNNWAALLEYRFNNRLSIQTGVIRSLKYYGALPSQYEWNKYWTMPSPLKDIDATCKMLDIPVNLRYDISQKYRGRWFVSAGFTSYIMLKEEYRYNYENPNDPNIKRTSWEGKTGAYPFSVLNLSAGYERQLFRR